eukprot:5141599-Pyramimonas_sp.AAC.2
MLLTSHDGTTGTSSLQQYFISGEKELASENPTAARDNFLVVLDALGPLETSSSSEATASEKERVANIGCCEHRLGMASQMLNEVSELLGCRHHTNIKPRAPKRR